jgi:undecaprenyl diphosphate synthase
MINNLERINKNKLPVHIAIIMDGNGRWAKQQGRGRMFGHKQGVEAVRKVVEASAELGVRYLTLYTFSVENWQRPRNEINALMKLLVSTIKKEISTLMKNNIRLDVIGDVQRLPESTIKQVTSAMKQTSGNTGLTLIMALSYSARWDILNASKRLAEMVENKLVNVNDINEELFSGMLSTANFPNPELLIRTSGETRISNFLLWELAYTELFFTPKNWPEFTKEDLYNAIVDYQSRERRFGKTSEQLH